MVEHSAILISKILKASHRHFSYDGWYGPIVMSQQWPAPADPLRGEMKGVGISGGLWLDLRYYSTLVRVPLLPLRPTRRDQSTASCWFHFKKVQRGTSDIIPWPNVIVLSFHCSFTSFISMLILLLFDPITLSCMGIHIFIFFPSV